MRTTVNNTVYEQALEILTDNNYHNDTSLLDCYLAFGIVPVMVNEHYNKEHGELWGILNELKAIDRKNYVEHCLRIGDIERRNALDNRVRELVKKYTEQEV